MTLQEIKNIFFEEFAYNGYRAETFNSDFPNSKIDVLSASKRDALPNEPEPSWMVTIRISWIRDGRHGFADKVLPVNKVTGGTREKHAYNGTKPVYNQYGKKTTQTTYAYGSWVEVTNISLENIH